MDRKLQIQDELFELAPQLAKLKKPELNQLPASYFESMQEKVMVKALLQDDAPPSEYFDAMQDQVMSKVLSRRKESKIRFLSITKWAAAASIALVMLWLPYYYYNQPTQDSYASGLNIDIDDPLEVDYLINYLNTDEDFNYLQSITSEESIPNSDIPASDELLLTDEELEILIEM